jgi:hypothetical protein
MFVAASQLPVEYGSVVQMGGVSCAVSEQGVDCKNADNHGFKLSRAAYIPY